MISIENQQQPQRQQKRTEAQILRSLVENGVAKRFDLRAWSNLGCGQPTGVDRLQVLLEQVRPDVAKLIVLEELEVRHLILPQYYTQTANTRDAVIVTHSRMMGKTKHISYTFPRR